MINKQIIENTLIYINDCIFKKNINLRNFIKNPCFFLFLKNLKKETIVVLGGDGTFLNILNKHYKDNIDILGINFGNIGFLLNNKNIIKTNKNIIKTKYNLLQCNIGDESFVCFNEFDIRSASGKSIELNIFSKDNLKLNIHGDGVIISTPVGSTGYNLSLCGPILPYNINAFIITPKAVFNPKLLSSIIMSSDEKIIIKNIGRKNKIQIYSDGKLCKNFPENKDINLEISISKYKITLLSNKDNKNEMHKKILKQQGFK